MSKTSRQRRPLHGVLLLDKPLGLSSNQALQQVKRLCHAAKAGHTGSLDPLATGMLPICFGEATKLTAFMLEADKSYDVIARLGVSTDTGDAEGEVACELPVPVLTDTALDQALSDFVGEIEQVPPMYSALKHEGQRLYALARRGIEVQRAPRKVHIHDFTILSYKAPNLEFRVGCSKGTYVRTLVEDLAKALGTVAHVIALRRLWVVPFTGERMIPLDALAGRCEGAPEAADELLLPVDSAIADWPRLVVGIELAQRLIQGQALPAEPSWPQTRVRLCLPGPRFFGIGEVLPDGRLVPRRILPGLSPWS